MLLGIMSDSHGDATKVRSAVALFDELGVAHIVHCGDVGGIDVFDKIVPRPLLFVWGNCDVVAGGLLAYLHSVEIPVPDAAPALGAFAGRNVAVFHGHEVGFRAFIRDGRADYVLHGHTHAARDERIGNTRVINPGALYRAQQKTVATLDIARDEVQFHAID